MKLMSRSFPFLVYIFIISSILSGFDEDAYSYTLNFETPKTDKAHFIINIDFSATSHGAFGINDTASANGGVFIGFLSFKTIEKSSFDKSFDLCWNK